MLKTEFYMPPILPLNFFKDNTLSVSDKQKHLLNSCNCHPYSAPSFLGLNQEANRIVTTTPPSVKLGPDIIES